MRTIGDRSVRCHDRHGVTLWMFWEGPCPAYIRLCLDTAQRHHHDVRLLDRDGFEQLWLEDRDIALNHLGLHHVADFVRAYLLKHHGGLYIDADTIVLRSLTPLIEAAAVHGLVGYREPQGYVSNNFIAARAGDVVISDYYAHVVGRLRDPRPLDWLEIGSDALDLAVRQHGGNALILPTRSIMPLAWHDSEKLAVERDDTGHDAHFMTDNWVWMLSNNTIKGHDATRIWSKWTAAPCWPIGAFLAICCVAQPISKMFVERLTTDAKGL